MKNFTVLFTALLMSLSLLAQAPMGINYQTVIRDGAGDILPDTELTLQMTIRSGAPDGAVVYQETHPVNTNAFGLVNLVIGSGSVQTGNFAGINWGAEAHYLETAVEFPGSKAFQVMGVMQFLSVPYALHSKTTETITETDPDFNAWNKSTGIVITEGQIIDLQDYLTQEVDPDFNAWDKSTGIVITEGQIIDLQNYLTQEVDPEFNAWDKSTGIVITEGQIIDLQEYLTQEVDPDFNAWDKSTGIVIAEGQIVDLQDYLTQEFDPDFNAWDKSTGIVITEGQIIDLQEYLTQEVDPEFNAWDRSTGIVITEGQIIDLQDYLTAEMDGDPANELQTISKSGLNVTLSQGGGTISVADNDNNPSNELQNITRSGLNITLSQGGGTISVADDDNDPVNELQTITEQDYQVTLSQGGGSFMTGVKSYTQAEIEAMTPYNGLTVHNSTTNCINYYYLNNWFEACGTCTPQPTTAAAGDDQSFTDNTTSTTLTANTPTQGTGLWTVESGEGGSFDDATNPAANFTGQPCTDYTLSWTITNTCRSSADQVDVSFFATPTEANAGNDTIVLGGDLSVNLNANTPEMGEGLWTILIGEGGILEDATNPQTLFTGEPYVNYSLQWTIATVCDASYDEVIVAFNPWQCGLAFIDARDSQSYETVQIGDQCWMAENLNIGTRIAGSSNQANNSTIEKYCYSNSDAQCDVYGGLYQWNEMMGYTTTPGVQGICPDGWHLPTDAEWTALTTYVSSQPAYLCNTNTSYIAKALAATTNWNSYSGTCTVGNNLAANNATNFTALPGGFRSTDGSFYDVSVGGNFWSSSAIDASDAWYRDLDYDSADVNRFNNYKSFGFSVRCLKDN